MSNSHENPYLPGIEPEEPLLEIDESDAVEPAAEAPAEQPHYEPITLLGVRRLMREREQGVAEEPEAGKIFIYPNLDEKYRITFGFWDQLSDGTLRRTALEPEDQELARKIAYDTDHEITGIRNGVPIYRNDDSQPNYKY